MARRGTIGRVAAGLAVAATAVGGGAATAAPSTTEGVDRTTASVPWWKVGPGWSVVLRTEHQWTRSPRGLYLVSTGGTAYPVGEVSDVLELLGVSADGKRLIYLPDPGRGCRVRSLTTGQTSSFTPSDGTCRAQFSRRSTQRILSVEGTKIVERTLGGAFVRRAYTSRSGDPIGRVVQSPAGNTLAVQEGGRVRMVRTSDGGVIRTMGTPPLSPRTTCAPRRWWSSPVLVVHCTDRSGHYDSPHRLWRWDTRQTAVGREITSGKRPSATNAWYKGGLYFESRDDYGMDWLLGADLQPVRWTSGAVSAETIVGSKGYGIDRDAGTYVIRNIPDRRTILPFKASGIRQTLDAVVIDPND